MHRNLLKILYLSIIILFVTLNLTAQTISFPEEPMLSRLEKIAIAGKEIGHFVTYESRFLEDIIAPKLTIASTDIEDWIRYSLKNTSLNYLKISLSRFVIIPRADETQNVGYLSGKITDTYGEPLQGATIFAQECQKGTITGLNGDYSFPLSVGKHAVTVRFMGFEPLRVTQIEIEKNRTTRLDAALKEMPIQLNDIVVARKPFETTIADAIRSQRNTPCISSVLSIQEVNAVDCHTVRDAVKLLPGIAANEKDEISVRGIGNRWNTILLDGVPLPIYDASFNVFSLNLIPVALVDNIRLLKSSTPDIPIGFAGGITEIATKDIPEQNYVQFKASCQFNTQTAFNTFRGRKNGKFDCIGLDDGSRKIPGNRSLFPASHFDITNQKTFPSQLYHFTMGRTYALNNSGDRLGFVLSLSYQNAMGQSAIKHTQRGRWDYIEQYTGNWGEKRNAGNSYQRNVVLGGILNAGWQFGKNRISMRNVFTRTFDNELTEITAYLKDISEDENNRSYQFFNYPVFSDLLQNKLEGKHHYGKLSLQWNASHTFVRRERKDAAFSEMYKPLKDDSLLYFMHQHPELRNIYLASSGWYDNRERDFYIGFSASIPFTINKIQNKLSLGYNGNHKRLCFTSNEALYSYDKESINPDPSSRIYQTLERNEYKGNLRQHHPFVMFEHRWMNKTRFVWGIRGDYENVGKSDGGEKRKWYIAPSANMIVTPLKDVNTRLSFQRSVVRPELADYVPFPMYDTHLMGTAVNRIVLPSTVDAIDFLVEKYIDTRDFVSAGLFYRHIHRPIERTTYLFRYDEPMYVLQNSDKAFCYGFETTVRSHLGFITDAGFLMKTEVSAGFTLSRSSVTGKRMEIVPQDNGEEKFTETKSTQHRPLTGQTPYLFNFGIRYTDKRIQANILFDRTGRQLFLLGENAYQHEYRAAMNSLEASISYRFPKNDILLKISGRNLLNAVQIFYTNTPEDYVRNEFNFPTDELLPRKTENYDKGRDPITHEVKNGQTFSISISSSF